jgi:dTDP-glucose pyrophosphorylase
MVDISAFQIKPLARIVEAVACIERGGRRMALVTDEAGRLIGTVADGDVRRGLLRGLTLDASVSEVMNPHPRLALVGTSPADILRMMRVMKLLQVPIVDDQGRVVDLFTAEIHPEHRRRPNRVVLMAGGLGKRLRPLTETVPKPMLAVGGKPILQIILESFIDQGFSRFSMSVNYLGEMIRRHFGDGSRWGVEIDYLEDGRQCLGTAGCLHLLPERPREPIVVMNGDILTSIDFHQMLDFHAETGSIATMGVYEQVVEVPFGVLEVEDNRIRAVREKPAQRFLINAGIYVLDAAALDDVPVDQPFDMPSLFEALIRRGRPPLAYFIWENWLDVGRPQDLERAQAVFSVAAK